MRVGVCSVGTELLSGDQVDTNAAWLSARLRELGAEPVLHVAVRDDLDEMVAALQWLLDHTDGLVIGGGLGPTPDDLTREAVAAAGRRRPRAPRRPRGADPPSASRTSGRG